jgi:hypothetical protein
MREEHNKHVKNLNTEISRKNEMIEKLNQEK